jgi:hypothetical protein
MIADSVVDPASGKVTSDVSKEVLNSPDYNGQLTVLLVTLKKDPPPIIDSAAVNITFTPAPISVSLLPYHIPCTGVLCLVIVLNVPHVISYVVRRTATERT